MPPDAGFIDIYTEARPLEDLHMTVGSRNWRSRNVLCQSGMRERQRPSDFRKDGSGMQCGRAGDARFAGLAGNIHPHAEAVAQHPGLGQRAEAAQLDRLQADTACRLALMMTPDVIE